MSIVMGAILKFIFWVIVLGSAICLLLVLIGLIAEGLFLDGSWRWGVRDDSDLEETDEED